MLSPEMPRRNVMVLVVSLVLATGCSAPVSHAYTTQGATTTLPPSPPPTSPEVVAAQAPATAEEPLVITGAGFDLHTAGTVSQAAFDAAWSGVLDTLNRYLEVAVLTPLRSGGPAGDLRPLFTPLSVARVMTVGDDRAAFIDEGLAPATDLHKEAAVATLTALAGVPTWGWLCLGGALLLSVGIALERSDTSPVEAGRRVVDVVAERFG